jgi:hypothetical protein
MAFINISSVYTADPNDVWTPKNAFMLQEPYAIVLQIQADSSVVSEGLLFDAMFQIVGPSQDLANGFPWWIIDTNGDIAPSPTRDVWWGNISFQWGTNFAIWWHWNKYSDAIAHVANSKQGVFYVQGIVNVQRSNLFAASERFWFKVWDPEAGGVVG